MFPNIFLYKKKYLLSSTVQDNMREPDEITLKL
jgi:hypothetical protein